MKLGKIDAEAIPGYITIRAFRGEPGRQYWEDFELPYDDHANVISCLMAICRNPITALKTRVAPIAWEAGCLEEVCGSCSMLINGVPRQACTALIRNIIKETGSTTVRLAPLSKFPLVRDLVVDRTRMFDHLRRISGWVAIEGYHDTGPGPKISQKQQEMMYTLSSCMTCGCCTESCPQVNEHSSFIGPAPIAQVRYFSIHPTGRELEPERLDAIADDGGISGCGNARNCSRVCPKKLPLTESISAVNRAVTKKMILDILGLPEA